MTTRLAPLDSPAANVGQVWLTGQRDNQRERLQQQVELLDVVTYQLHLSATCCLLSSAPSNATRETTTSLPGRCKLNSSLVSIAITKSCVSLCCRISMAKATSLARDGLGLQAVRQSLPVVVWAQTNCLTITFNTYRLFQF